MTGSDGIAEVSRLVVRALGPATLDVISLTDHPGFAVRDIDDPAVHLVGAGGRRSRLVAAVARAAVGSRRAARVLCLHSRLSPLGSLFGPRQRLTVFLHGIEAWRPLRRLERLALSGAATLVANSAHTAERFRQANPDFRDRPVHVCHLGVRARRTHGAGPRVVDGEAPFALTVGRMVAEERYKGHDLLLDVWPTVVDRVPAARLVVVGDGDDRARLHARAAALGGRVTFVGRVPDADLARLYRECAFFVMPSRDEGFGLVFAEAMQAGKACVGGVGAAAEVIEDGVTGFVVKQERADVVRAVVRLFRDAETREQMGRAGAARVAARFTEEHFRRRFRALLGLEASVSGSETPERPLPPAGRADPGAARSGPSGGR